MIRGNSLILSFRINPELRSKLDAYCIRYGYSIGKVCRLSLEALFSMMED